MILGTAEEWKLTSNMASDHPYHIHVNWFELLQSVDGSGRVTKYDPPIWMDTANIPADGHIITRMRLQNFQGLSVFHCHILTHEDEGMMALIEIVDGSPKTVTITPTGGTVVSPDYTNRVQVRFLPGSVRADTEITYQHLSSPNVPTVNPAPALPKNMADYNLFFNLGAQQGGKALGELNRPATIIVKYSAAQVVKYTAAQTKLDPKNVNPKVDPASIQLYSYDDNRKAWSPDGISLIGRTDDLVTCSTMRLGKFAVTGTIMA
jgi:hypothetical protein